MSMCAESPVCMPYINAPRKGVGCNATTHYTANMRECT